MNVTLTKIEKSFGSLKVLDKVSFTAESGSAYGLLGRNGAGKTTTIRITMGVFPADGGTVSIDGKRVSESNATFGYLPEERGLYPKHPIGLQLAYIGMLRGMNRTDAEKSAKGWLERFAISDAYDKKLTVLSKGNQQKIQLAAALINDPDIVILDEPFSGFDPVNAQMLKDVVSELVENGKVVLFSSHQMNYVEEFCDNIALLNKGKIVLEGNLREIKRAYDRSSILVSFDDDDNTYSKLCKLGSSLSEFISEVENRDGNAVIKLKKPEFRKELLSYLTSKEYAVERFEVLLPTLEEIFVEKVGEAE